MTIDIFETSEFHILCNVRCIGEGVNIPCIDTVMFMEPRESNIGVTQNIGRGLRKHPDKDFCMVIIVEDMIKHKFIENLLVYDRRLSNPRGMLITRSPHFLKEPKYSVEGIVNIVERYSSCRLNETEMFILRLKALGICTKTDYYKVMDKEHLPRAPEDLSGFTWNKLYECKNPYLYDECVAKILELSTFHKEALKNIGSKKDKIIYLYKFDNQINPELIDQLVNDLRLKVVFKSRNRR